MLTLIPILFNRTTDVLEVRDIFDKLNIAVVLVGTDRLDAVIKKDEQVYNRFRACHRLKSNNQINTLN